MKIVIDIPEEAKKAFDCAESNDLKGGYYDLGGVVGIAIKNGTPLKKGEWILQGNGKCKLKYAVRFKCSNCNKITFEESNYCPRCGAEMESDLMKLVIDISESKIKDPSSIDLFYMVGAIKNGIPLPKGHGRIIDADALIEQIKKSRCIDCNSINGVRCRACQYDDEMADIDDAPTIIEADKESEV